MKNLFNDPTVHLPASTRCVSAGWRALVDRRGRKWAYAVQRLHPRGRWETTTLGGPFASAKGLAKGLATDTDGTDIPVCADAATRPTLEKALREAKTA